MSWMILQQTPHNEIRYITDSNSNMSYSGYNEFLLNMLKYPIARKQDFKKAIDKFQTIFVSLDNGEWEIKKQEKQKKDYTFEELVKLNPKEEDQEKKSKYDIRLEKGHNFIQKSKEFKFYDR